MTRYYYISMIAQYPAKLCKKLVAYPLATTKKRDETRLIHNIRETFFDSGPFMALLISGRDII